MSSANALPLPLSPFSPFEGQRPDPKPSRGRRHTSPEQGRALEVLGHAIEYLVDSRLFDQWETPADAEAVHLLMACSRSVFAACDEVHPWPQRVQQAFLKRLHLQASHTR